MPRIVFVWNATYVRAYARLLALVLLLGAFFLPGAACTWNNPYPGQDASKNVYYTFYLDTPKHLDPAISYSADESAIIGQIYVTPFQYHYLKRPSELIGYGAEEVPKPEYYGKDGTLLESEDPAEEAVGKVIYRLKIRKGMKYQPHPCFAKDKNGGFLYRNLNGADIKGIKQVKDFKETGTREVTAWDYAYQICRFCDPSLGKTCPIQGDMAECFVGMKEYVAKLKEEFKKKKEVVEKAKEKKKKPDPIIMDLPLFEGLQVPDDYTLIITLNQKFPHLPYWMAMPFFGPMPHEAVEFYAQTLLLELGITLDRFPVGSGPYMIEDIVPNRDIVLVRNPNFFEEFYPSEGEKTDEDKGHLKDAGQKLPFIDKIIQVREKEAIPRWQKFLQGYFDVSGIGVEMYDQAISVQSGTPEISSELKNMNISLVKAAKPSIYYWCLNMKDPVYGALTEESRKIRRAIAIALDMDEFIQKFLNGRGASMTGPVPEGIFGFMEGEESVNEHIQEWDEVAGKAKMKSLDYAKQLLKEAGYPNGIDQKTGKQLTLNYDNTANTAGQRAEVDWFIKSFAKIGILLESKTTDYSQFQQKTSTGNFQFITWGWNADFPDPENFFFLLYGPRGRADHKGENACNYASADYDNLYLEMKNMGNGPERMEIIRKMVKILQEDLPWINGYYPEIYILKNEWVHNYKYNPMNNCNIKHWRVDGQLRAQKRAERNKAVLWPLGVLVLLLVVGFVPALLSLRMRAKLI